ncbi:MAG: hypothetical protein JST96_13665 [Bacteroidetes bacterium]|nr:hypothetical protein [Bacteroidota bacterium]
MKKSIFLIATLVSTVTFSYPQDTLPQKEIKFKATIRTTKLNLQRGYLFGISNTDIHLSKTKAPLRFYGLDNSPETSKFNFSDIDLVSIRRRNSIGRGAAIGSVSGALLFGIIAAVSSSSESSDTWQIISPGAQIAGGVIVGGIAGAGIGILIGALAHKTFIIHGKKERFEKMRNAMMSKVSL